MTVIPIKCVLLDNQSPSGEGVSTDKLKQTPTRIYVPRGCDVRIDGQIWSQAGTPLNATGYAQPVLSMRDSPSGAIAQFVRICNWLDATQGTFQGFIYQTDTAALLPDNWWYDVQVSDGVPNKSQVMPFSPLVLMPVGATPADMGGATSGTPALVPIYGMPVIAGNIGRYLQVYDSGGGVPAIRWAPEIKAKQAWTAGSGLYFVDITFAGGFAFVGDYYVSFTVFQNTYTGPAGPIECWAAPRPADAPNSLATTGFRLWVNAPFDGSVMWRAWQ